MNGLGAHGFINLPIRVGHPEVYQKCDYPTCEIETSSCCVNKGCTKKKENPSAVVVKDITGLFIVIIIRKIIYKKWRKYGLGDEKSVHYYGKICVGYP